MFHPHRCGLLVLVVFLLFARSAALAADVDKLCNNNQDEECVRLLNEGFDNFQNGDLAEKAHHLDQAKALFAAAAQLFEKAYALHPEFYILANQARALDRSGRRPDAVTLYRQILDAGAVIPEQLRRSVQGFLEAAQRDAAPAPALPPMPTPAPQPSVEVAAPGPRQPPPRVPLYKKPWLWAVVGVTAAGVAVAVGLGLAARRPDLSAALPAYPFPN